MSHQLKSLTQSPILLAPNRVWRIYRGGRTTDRLQGKLQPTDAWYPEEWVGSCVQAANPAEHFKEGEGLALISKGLSEPVTLKSVIEQFPEEMLGSAHVKTYGSNPALLVKLLDAAIRLLIHAHPSKDFAKQHLNSCFGKTEAWFILETRPEVDDPFVLIAFKKEVSKSQYRDILRRQDMDAMMNIMHRVPVKAGDVVYVKAGLPHAIGEGTFMVELQEPTDFSVILERVTPGYTFREDECFLGLDPDLVLSDLIYRSYSPEEVQRQLVIKPKLLRREGESAEYQLLGYDTTECFAGNRLDIKNRLNDSTHGRYTTLIVLDGEGKFLHAHGEVPLRRGAELFVPASVGEHQFVTSSSLTVFKCLPAQL